MPFFATESGSKGRLEARGEWRGVVNSIRRSLLQDVTCWAPSSVVFTVNTSCQTDEYLSHRMGLVPWRQEDLVGRGEIASSTSGMEVDAVIRSFHAKGSDLWASSVSPVSGGDVCLMRLARDQELKGNILFRPGGQHVRYNPVAAVSFRAESDSSDPDERGEVVVGWESINDLPPKELLRRAVLSLKDQIRSVRETVQSGNTYQTKQAKNQLDEQTGFV